ncbi:MAG: hypothetical protein PHR43_04545 [Dehalococcoidales bacterium]|nr:hypothetical protein [Dehalococcoidales bacterium]
MRSIIKSLGSETTETASKMEYQLAFCGSAGEGFFVFYYANPE